ncbi:MAG TPA: YgiQ family radical SAM protein [Halanaerobiales bacterium]|nr:YgiQ family radical SAM protein [Halanaerobiales bacterium]
MRKDDFLPINKNDLKEREWEQLDFILVTGDAYVDHPSFGTAIISRVLEDGGFKVGIISQPDWRNTDDFKKLGKPRYGFLVTAGNLDSMVNKYTVNKRKRFNDRYSPGGKSDQRPDRATIVYCNRLKEAYNNIPIIIGGIEASLRRFAYYDYWDDDVRRSILFDSRADLLVYGMGEKQILEIANSLEAGMDIKYIRHIPGTCYILSDLNNIYGYKKIASYQEVKNNKKKYAKAFKVQYEEQDPIRGEVIVQEHGNRYLVQNQPVKPLTEEEMDHIYELPYQRDYHPIYETEGGVPAIDEVKFSITSSRGCFGGCSFCALTFHQGRQVVSRSKESILKEAKEIIKMNDFKGYIHDVGGPTANFRHPACTKQVTQGSCKNKHCLYPEPCSNLHVDHSDYLDILKSLRKISEIKKVFIRSGLRYDYILEDDDSEFLEELCKHHVSGQLKVAPEHISKNVLDKMRKPDNNLFNEFRNKFYEINEKINKEQYLIPYFISSHPGSELKDAIKLAEYLRDIGHIPEQVQDFYPTPGTLSTAMYFSGYDPLTMEKVYVPKTKKEKNMQRALLQYNYNENYDLVYDALKKTGREDLIGYHKKALIKPRN